MFGYCDSLTSIDVSSFNTENAETMEFMFYTCLSLTSINLSNFNTKNLLAMDTMFCSCESLTSLDLSNFDTSKVEDINSMFGACHSLKYLNISTFTKFIHIGPLLGGCKSLSILDMSSFLDFNDKGYPIFVRFSDSGTFILIIILQIMQKKIFQKDGKLKLLIINKIFIINLLFKKFGHKI